jgi:hypothetical protein
MVSDFFDDKNYRQALKVAGRKHDCIAVTLSDPREQTIPPVGLIELEDAETGQEMLVDSSDSHFQSVFKARVAKMVEERRQTFRKADVEQIDVYTDRDYVEPVIAFFRKREKLR